MVIILLLSLFYSTNADILAVDRVYPLLNAGGRVIDWSSGGGSALLASSPLIRINLRGIRVIKTWGLHNLRPINSLGWASIRCNVSAWALCESELGRVFPTNAQVLKTTGRPRSLPSAWQDSWCAQSTARRIVSTDTYDVGACDILDEGLDLILKDSILYKIRNSPGDAVYWILVICAVILVRGLSKNVRAAIGGTKYPQGQDLSLIISLITIITVAHEGGQIYATETDFWFYGSTMIYTISYSIYHGVFRFLQGSNAPPIYNMAAGAFQLISSRLYSGAETPYNPIVLFVVSTRTWAKLKDPSFYNVLTGFIDGFYIALCCDWGFTYDRGYLIALFSCSYLASQHVFGQK